MSPSNPFFTILWLALVMISIAGCTSSSSLPLNTGSNETPVVTPPIDGVLAGFASGSFDNITNGAISKVISTNVTLNFITEKTGQSVSIFFDQYCLNPIATTTIGPGASSFLNLTFAADGSDDGRYNIYFKISGVSASSCASTGLNFTLDTKAPASIVSRLYLIGIANSGYSNDTTPEFSGTYLSAEKGTVVEIFDTNTCTTPLASGVTQVDGSILISGATYTPTTDDGFKDFYARLEDAAGNIQNCHKIFLSYYLDTVVSATPTGTFSLNLGSGA